MEKQLETYLVQRWKRWRKPPGARGVLRRRADGWIDLPPVLSIPQTPPRTVSWTVFALHPPSHTLPATTDQRSGEWLNVLEASQQLALGTEIAVLKISASFTSTTGRQNDRQPAIGATVVPSKFGNRSLRHYCMGVGHCDRLNGSSLFKFVGRNMHVSGIGPVRPAVRWRGACLP